MLINRGLDGAPHLAVPKFGLGLPLELRLHDLHAENTREALTHVVTRQAFVVLLENIVPTGIVVDRPRERRLEPGKMGPTFMCVDVVDEGVRVLAEAVIVLHGQLDVGLLTAGLEVDDLFVKRLPGTPHVLDERGEPTFVLMGLLGAITLVGEYDLQTLIEERELTEPVVEGLEVV